MIPENVWLFGYGSLIWRPGFAYSERSPARLAGFARRFWQGSHDHRGLPHAPGRVVTLVPAPSETCVGVAYLISEAIAEQVFVNLDHREKNGYRRQIVNLSLADDRVVEGLVYIASELNHAFLGPAPVSEMAQQILRSNGPSGPNREYLYKLASALRALGAKDPHVFDLEAAVRALPASAADTVRSTAQAGPGRGATGPAKSG